MKTALILAGIPKSKKRMFKRLVGYLFSNLLPPTFSLWPSSALALNSSLSCFIPSSFFFFLSPEGMGTHFNRLPFLFLEVKSLYQENIQNDSISVIESTTRNKRFQICWTSSGMSDQVQIYSELSIFNFCTTEAWKFLKVLILGKFSWKNVIIFPPEFLSQSFSLSCLY